MRMQCDYCRLPKTSWRLGVLRLLRRLSFSLRTQIHRVPRGLLYFGFPRYFDCAEVESDFQTSPSVWIQPKLFLWIGKISIMVVHLVNARIRWLLTFQLLRSTPRALESSIMMFGGFPVQSLSWTDFHYKRPISVLYENKMRLGGLVFSYVRACLAWHL